MDIKRTDNTIEFEIEVSAEELEQAMESVYQRDKKHFSLPGFRKGRVPRQLLESNYGSGIFFEDAINEVLPEKYDEIVKEENLKIAGRPSIDLKDEFVKGEGVTLVVTVDVMPEFDIDGYKGLEIEVEKPEVSDADLDMAIDTIREQHGRMSIIEDRPVEEEDVVVIDFTGFVDGEEFEGGSGSDFELTIGSGQFIPGFEDQLIGAESGEDVEVTVTFPEEYPAEDLAGKEAKFDVAVKEIREINLPELDDDFVMDISEFETVDEFKADLQEDIEKEVENKQKEEIKNKVIDQVVGLVDIEVPEDVIEHNIDQEINSLSYNLQSQGLPLDQYLAMVGTNLEQVREDFREIAEDKAKLSLILEKIAEKEDIEVTEEDMRKQLAIMAESFIPEDDEEEKERFIDRMMENEDQGMKDGMLNEVVIDFLVDNAKVKEVKGE